ncbi:hypothetical protein N8I77_000990 [Diaporthe amygdali]|uniref:DUF6987 domain-containing protein n=1 Tax=Phomopsis amygdali TaxID=1214568 RepID=A0AAD9SR60_PHOAM|nr:hypothetical protein N8I77_000990 [Diaporthe amygdali]
MADTQPPGGWPWGKNKQQSSKGDDASEAPTSTAQQQLQDKGVQEPEVLQEESGNAQSQVQSKVGDAKSAAGSTANKSVRYEGDDEAVKGPGSNNSFSRNAKEPSVMSNGYHQDDISEEANGAVENAQETAESKKDDLPEDEGKDLTEPAEQAGEEGTEKVGETGEEAKNAAPSQTGSRFSNFVSGASRIVPSFGGGSKKSQAEDDSEIPESIRKIQSQIGDTGTNLTLPEGSQAQTQGTDLKSSAEEGTEATTQEGTEQTPAETDVEATTEHATTTAKPEESQLETEGDELDDSELRPEDSVTYAADNSQKVPGGEETEGESQAQGTLKSLPEGTQLPEGFTESQVDLSDLPEGTQLPDGTQISGSQLQDGTFAGTLKSLPEGTQLPEGFTESQVDLNDLPEGTQLPDGTQISGSQLQDGTLGTQIEGTEAGTQAEGTQAEGTQAEGTQAPGSEAQIPDDQQTEYTYASGYPTATVQPEAEIDYSILKDAKVNKLGNVVNEKGQAIGRITQGIMAHLIGRKVDENGIIWNDSGKEIGRAEPIPDNELQELMESKPFESFEGNTIDAKGKVMWEGQQVGQVIEGDLKVLQGKTVDADGEVLDKAGNVIGKAERWEEEEEPEPEPEAEVDKSILAGKRVNKAGNVVDSAGVIFGRVVDGDVSKMVGRMCNKLGEILSESGDVIGHAELVTEGEREGSKEGIFAELQGLTVNKEGHVVTPGGDIVGRLIEGDPKKLAGRVVDQDGDILDSNGNVLGKAERWEPEEVEKKKGALAGLHVNQEGNVVDTNGNIVAKLTSGDPLVCAGLEIDDDGDVVNSKGQAVGHVNLLSEIPQEEEVGETEEEKEERLQREQDKKLAIQMAACLENCLDKIKPICKMITTKIEAMERKPEDERDEEALVKEVRPLIEEGSNILREAHGVIRGIDPDGHIQANAKHKSGTREATPEEFHLAEVIKELTGTVTETIEGAKRKLEDMPHAKKELNPLWGLLGEPLFQIIAAVGLLLTGVLGIVGRLLSGLGLGGVVDGLLGTLGLNRLLDGLGLGSVVGALTGKDKKKK